MDSLNTSPGTLAPITVSVKEAARAIGVSPFTMYQLLDEKKVDSRYQGRRRLVIVDSLRAYVSNLPTERAEESA